jgi:hypothetical protein
METLPTVVKADYLSDYLVAITLQRVLLER